VSERTRRLVAATGVSIVLVAAIIATFAALSNDDPVADLRRPVLVPRPLITAAFLATPGLIAAVGALRRASVIVVIAGVCALLQSFVAFSGVAFGFILPALVLIYLGMHDADSGSPTPRRREYGIGLMAVAFLIAAWAVTLGNTETTCWIASAAPDGHIAYRTVPDTGSLELGVADLAGSCDAGPTMSGVIAAATLLVGSVSVACLARPASA
jgi:hypothetical protein